MNRAFFFLIANFAIGLCQCAIAASSVSVTTRYSGLSQSGMLSASVSGLSNAGLEAATADASASPGVLKLAGTATAKADPTVWIEYLVAGSTSSASWSDIQTYTSPIVPLGASLQINARILIVAGLSTNLSGNGVNANLTARSNWSFTSTFNGAISTTATGFDQWFSDSGRTFGQNVNGASVIALGSFLLALANRIIFYKCSE